MTDRVLRVCPPVLCAYVVTLCVLSHSSCTACGLAQVRHVPPRRVQRRRRPRAPAPRGRRPARPPQRPGPGDPSRRRLQHPGRDGPHPLDALQGRVRHRLRLRHLAGREGLLPESHPRPARRRPVLPRLVFQAGLRRAEGPPPQHPRPRPLSRGAGGVRRPGPRARRHQPLPVVVAFLVLQPVDGPRRRDGHHDGRLRVVAPVRLPRRHPRRHRRRPLPRLPRVRHPVYDLVRRRAPGGTAFRFRKGRVCSFVAQLRTCHRGCHGPGPRIVAR